jgi:dipeptidyl aminopeptidase/acylaminoacyl peptidase
MRFRWIVIAAVIMGFTVQAPVTLATTNDAALATYFDQEFDGRNLKLGKTVARTGAYTTRDVTYLSGDLTISGRMNIPKGKGPFPVVVLAHGYIDPRIYVSGQGFRREQDWLARNGYVTLHTDYRNHAGSDKDPRNDINMRIGYAIDVINAGRAVRKSTLPFIDSNRVALLGRSMGGGVGLQALVMEPGVFDAAVFYASTSSNIADNFNKWQRNDGDLSRKILARYGEPRANPQIWAQMSSRTYFNRITEPVLMFHGTRDDSCDIRWARATDTALKKAGVDAKLVEYAGAGHAFYGPWSDSIRRADRFFMKHMPKTDRVTRP